MSHASFCGMGVEKVVVRRIRLDGNARTTDSRLRTGEKTTMRFYLTSIMVLLLAVTTANAEFVVWLSDKAPGENPVAGLLNATLASPSATGNLYLYGDGDTQLSGLSLDVLATGNAIKFTSATVNNPGGRWSFLDGPLTIGDSLITNIGGGAI